MSVSVCLVTFTSWTTWSAAFRSCWTTSTNHCLKWPSILARIHSSICSCNMWVEFISLPLPQLSYCFTNVYRITKFSGWHCYLKRFPLHCKFMFLPSVLWRCWLGGRKGIRPVKNRVVGCWHFYLSGARCRLAYGPADATATHCLLLQ